MVSHNIDVGLCIILQKWDQKKFLMGTHLPLELRGCQWTDFQYVTSGRGRWPVIAEGGPRSFGIEDITTQIIFVCLRILQILISRKPVKVRVVAL